MATANREERRLMRQRGAGTRQTQEVNFGFSFGTPVAAPAQPRAPSPQPEQSSSASRRSSRRGPTPETQQSLLPPESARRNSQTKLQTPTTRRSSGRRSPASSRNGHTSSSVYDIPPDSPQDLSSSAKRRRVGPGPRDGSIQTIPENSPLETNGVGPHGIQSTEASEQPQSVESQKAAEFPASTKSPSRSKAQTPQLHEPSSSIPAVRQDGSDVTQPRQTPINNSQNGTSALVTQSSLAKSSSKPQGGKSGKKGRKRKSIVHWAKKPRRSSDEANKRRNEEAQAEQAPELEPEPEQEPEPEPEPELPEQPQHSPARKRRKSKSIVQQPEAQEIAPEAAEERGGSNVAEEGVEMNETAAKPPEKKAPRRKKRQSVLLQKKKKPKAPRPPSISQQPEGEDEVNEEAEQTAEQENAEEAASDEPEPSPHTETRNKRRTTGQGRTKPRRQLETVQEEPETQAGDEGGQAESSEQAPRKKPRKARQANSEKESRKNSFPVTVHRLANVSALDALSEADDSPHEANSSDELAIRSKFPNRSGVNPADVLSQICRETLDKTLSALENGISNESQPARRAEFTRKRKAVEAFSAELEGRLFDMSEVLDSNFALAMNLRKAKKEMMDSRSKLMDIRRQREEIALKTDEVRRKHLEEEKMQTQHNAVNNSLHSLELAIDRDQSHAESLDKNNPAAGLEFLLRSVADDVSSTAPGSQGGLLNQIKSFNARLEERVKGAVGR